MYSYVRIYLLILTKFAVNNNIIRCIIHHLWSVSLL